MKTIISTTDFYTIKVDQQKQRLYLKLNGFWQNPSVVKGYVNDVERSFNYFDKSFTCLADLSELMPYSSEVKNCVHKVVEKKLRTAGVKNSAQIMPTNFDTNELLEIDGGVGVSLNSFGDEEIAEMYLDTTTTTRV